MNDLERLSHTPSWEWPDDAGRTIRAALGDAATRTEALALASDVVVQDDEMARALLAIVEDAAADEEDRANAALALGPGLEMCDEAFPFDPSLGLPFEAPWSEPVFAEVRAALERLHGDASAPDLLRRMALEAAVRAPRPWQKKATEAAFARPEPEWQRTALFAAGHVGGFDGKVLERLLSGDAEILREALRAAGRREHPAASKRALSLASDPKADRPLRLAATEALGGLRPDGAEALLRELTQSDDEELAAVAEEALTFVRLDDDLLDLDDR